LLRKCKDCGCEAHTEEDLAKFINDPGMKHGKKNLCLVCKSVRAKGYYKNTLEETKERSRLWYAENTEAAVATRKKYYKINQTAILAQKREYQKENSERLKEYLKNYYKENKETLQEKSRQYCKDHRAQKNAHESARRTLKLSQTPELTKVEKEKIVILYKIAQSIKRTTGVLMHVDHIIPVSKGGLHHPLNLQVITATENLEKADKMPEVISKELQKLHDDFYSQS